MATDVLIPSLTAPLANVIPSSAKGVSDNNNNSNYDHNAAAPEIIEDRSLTRKGAPYVKRYKRGKFLGKVRTVVLDWMLIRLMVMMMQRYTIHQRKAIAIVDT